jgi:hypothetical protein
MHGFKTTPFTFLDFSFNLGEIIQRLIQRPGIATFATASNLHAEENRGDSDA